MIYFQEKISQIKSISKAFLGSNSTLVFKAYFPPQQQIFLTQQQTPPMIPMTTAVIPAMSTTQAQVSNSHWPTVPFSNPVHLWKNWQSPSFVHVEPALSTMSLKSVIPSLTVSSILPATFSMEYKNIFNLKVRFVRKTYYSDWARQRPKRRKKQGQRR